MVAVLLTSDIDERPLSDSSCTKEFRMRETPGPNGSHQSSILVIASLGSFLCVALWGAHALGQSQPTTKPPAAKPHSAPGLESSPEISPAPKDQTPPKGRVAPRGKTTPKRKFSPVKSGRRNLRKPKFQMNPNAKWACDKQTVTLPPTWRGPQSLTFEFDIRNEGTEVLKIQAKGG